MLLSGGDIISKLEITESDDSWLAWLHGGHHMMLYGGALFSKKMPGYEKIEPRMDERTLVKWIGYEELTDDTLPEALALAKDVHAGRISYGNVSYLERHIYPVTAALLWLRDYRDSESMEIKREVEPWVLSAALIHDVLDYSDTDASKIEETFGTRIYEAVVAGTRARPGEREVDESEYAEKLSRAPAETRVIKIADRINRLLCVKMMPESEGLRFVQDTREFYLTLASHTSVYLYRWMSWVLNEIQPGSGT